MEKKQTKLRTILEPFRNHFRTVSEVFYHFGSICVPFRKFLGAFWDILTQFVKTVSSHPQMHLLDKFYTQSN